MNEKFFQLPQEKQEKIIQAGFRVFSQNSYKKSPMSEIAAEASISKSLLFHYFTNKKDLYLFLWDHACQTTIQLLTQAGCYESDDLFELMENAMNAKLHLTRNDPHMAAFAIKAFYEKDPEVAMDIQKSYQKYFDLKAAKTLTAISPNDFKEGLDLKMMYRDMYWASEGYLWEMCQRDEIDPDKMEDDFRNLLSFWKTIYLRGNK